MAATLHSVGVTMPTLGIALATLAVMLLRLVPVTYASGGSCLPRALTPAEKQAGERVAAQMRPLLPQAPAGWEVDGPDAVDIASGSCLDPVTHKSVPQPVSVQVRRTFRRDVPPPTAAEVDARVAAAMAPRPPAPGPDPARQARAKALEQQIRDLKGKEQAAIAAYQAARRAGDREGQRTAIAESRALRAAMDQPSKELLELRKAEHQQREAENAVLHEAAVAQTRTMLANRKIAGVAINTNSGRALSRASQTISIPGVALAITQPSFSTNLLFGNGWVHQRHQAWRPWNPGAPTSRVQDVNVAVDGNDEVMQALIRQLDLKALDALIER